MVAPDIVNAASLTQEKFLAVGSVPNSLPFTIPAATDPDATTEVMLDIFGSNFYLEMMRVGVENEDLLNKSLIRLSNKYDIPIVATNDCHYPFKEDGPIHESLLRINTNNDTKIRNDNLKLKEPNSDNNRSS